MSQGLSYGPAAELYDRIRPTYPSASVEWALGPARLRVVDLGAGTGILTRVLLAPGHDVLPVEPDEAMRARLARTTPGTSALAGTAEEIPVPDGSVDAVLPRPIGARRSRRRSGSWPPICRRSSRCRT